MYALLQRLELEEITKGLNTHIGRKGLKRIGYKQHLHVTLTQIYKQIKNIPNVFYLFLFCLFVFFLLLSNLESENLKMSHHSCLFLARVVGNPALRRAISPPTCLEAMEDHWQKAAKQQSSLDLGVGCAPCCQH